MKNLLISLFLFFSITTVFAQSKPKKVETAEFKVEGVCGMCKNRIETAALIGGVKFAEWNKETQILKVIYKTKNTSAKDVKQAVADAGHDTKEIKAKTETYKMLPQCCAYRDGMEKH